MTRNDPDFLPCIFCGEDAVHAFTGSGHEEYAQCRNPKCKYTGMSIPAQYWQARGEKLDPAIYAQFEASLKAEREKSEELLAMCNEVLNGNIAFFGSLELLRESYKDHPDKQARVRLEKLVVISKKYSQ